MEQTLIFHSPDDFPKDLTSLSGAYKVKASLAVLAIVLFFALYVLLVIGLGYLIRWSIFYEIENVNKLTILAKLGAIAGSVMLFAFTLKFIFKLRNHKPDNRIKLEKEDYPELFGFVDQICRETGAPKPKSIYVDPDVNAYVAYTNVWLSLFAPTGKDLTIGLGLVSILNISEFKAVTAHEFGHFAQKSMKIGSYIHSANSIIHSMIYSRDKWDELLDRWRSSDIRLSAAAWAITPIIWLIRKTLEGFYMFLNLMHSALSHEMEFNADKVAVKTSGSMAIVSALWKLDFGSGYWNTIMNNAYHATKKNVFTDNLYQHNLKSIEKDRPNLNSRLDELPEETDGVKRFFSVSNASSASMYSSHPPNDHRERNAKTPFVACQTDERSAWLLFNNAELLQQKMTLLVYENYLGKKPENFAALAEFEKFIEAESRNANLTAEFENTFQDRFLTIPDLEDFKYLPAFEGDFNRQDTELKNKLSVLMEPVKAIEAKMIIVQQIANGERGEKSFEYNGVNYPKKQMQDCYNVLYNERETLFNETFANWDAEFLKLNFQLAKSKNKEAKVLDLYRQHKAIIAVFRGMIEAKINIHNGISRLQSMGNDLTQQLINELAEEITRIAKMCNTKIAQLEKINFVPIPNIDNLGELKEAITEGGKLPEENGPLFENGGVDRLLYALENAVANCNRIENKIIDVLLQWQSEMKQA